MNRATLIAGRELRAYLVGLQGYIVIALMLMIDGLLFNSYATALPGKLSSEVMADFFSVTSGITLIGTAFLSMRLLAEERATGTIVLLYSSPVSEWEIVVGKFGASLAYLAVFFLGTLLMPALVAASGKVSLGHIFSGYLGLFLVGSMGLGIGLFASALTAKQVFAAVVAGTTLLFLTTCWLLGKITEPPLTDFVTALAWWGHFDAFRVGLIQLKHVSYFVLVTVAALSLTVRALEARKWQ